MKFRNLFITTILFLSCMNMSAQDWRNAWMDQIWTNGSEMLVSCPLNDKQVLFVANGYFDAGYGYLFQINQKGVDNYELKGIPESAITSRPENLTELAKMILDNECANGGDGEVWKRKMVNNFDLLISYRSDNTIATVFEQTGREMSEVAQDGMQSIIVGKYSTAKGVKYQFNADGSCIWGGKTSSYYFTFQNEAGCPTYHIVVDRRIWELVPTLEGMDIYLAEHNEEGGTQRKGLYASLKASKSAPRWSFTSDRPVNDYAVGTIENKEMVRLMRNEIFARHGYVFSDPKLKAYFKSCSWYKPVGDNSKVKLSEMELINVAVIKNNE